MPASLASESDSGIRTYDITFTEGCESGLVGHAMLYTGKSLKAIGPDTFLDHFHMGPPLQDKQCTIYAFGNANLTDAQILQIKTFVDERRSEKLADDKRREQLGQRLATDFDQYWLIPDALPPNRSRPLWKFSCVGFVRESYRQANIELLADEVPNRTADELKRFYPAPQILRVLDSVGLRTKFIGLEGDGPWRVSLAGYALHALNRPADEINGKLATPYKPSERDSHYPHIGDERSKSPSRKTFGSKYFSQFMPRKFP